jgi:hypothetical protein
MNLDEDCYTLCEAKHKTCVCKKAGVVRCEQIKRLVSEGSQELETALEKKRSEEKKLQAIASSHRADMMRRSICVAS